MTTMKSAIGLVEYRSIAKAVESTDAMLKAANVSLIMSNPICPGKYISIITGEVGAVQSGLKAGVAVCPEMIVEHHIIPNVSPAVIPALTGTSAVGQTGAVGMIETLSAISAIIAADVAVKASNITLIDIRIARGLGGKGYLVMTGEIASVKAAVTASTHRLAQEGTVVATSVIASPTKEIIQTLL